jgi:hypothetical protein
LYEPTFNLFLYVAGGSIGSIGIAVHFQNGRDDEKVTFLQSRVDIDCHAAQRFQLSVPLTWERYAAMMRLGRHIEVFEAATCCLNAPQHPIMVITPVVDGSPRVMAIAGLGPINLKELEGIWPQQGTMPDYLQEYMSEGTFDIPRMLSDDFFEAIRILFNGGKYISACKLLVSLIDTLSFVEYGDVSKSFSRWLDAHTDLASIGIISVELWEFRNALLHMSNQESRKVRAGDVHHLVPFVGQVPPEVSMNTDSHKYFSLPRLIAVVAAAIGAWIASYNEDPSKLENFIDRYDTVLSDARYATVQLRS